jgi:Holliday junction resolvase RusA-like endonuclease
VMDLSVVVYGIPQPQGSTRAFIPRGWTRPVITTDNTKLKPWRQELAQTVVIAMRDRGAQMAARGVPIAIALTFVFEKPKSEKKSTVHKVTKPDLDKLLRAVLDALTGIAYADDSQVTECHVAKVFGSPARLEVQIRTLAEAIQKTTKNGAPQLFEDQLPLGDEIAIQRRVLSEH